MKTGNSDENTYRYLEQKTMSHYLSNFKMTKKFSTYQYHYMGSFHDLLQRIPFHSFCIGFQYYR